MAMVKQIVFGILVIPEILSYRFDFVLNLTKSLSATNTFYNFIVFQNEFAFLSHIEGPSLVKELQLKFDVPLICCNNQISKTIRLRDTLNVNSLGFVVMNELQDVILNVTEKVLTKLHNMKVIFMLVSSPASITGAELKTFFYWCWEVNLLNVILTFVMENGMTNEVHTYSPFPRVHTINLTESHVAEYFWNKAADIKGYKFATPVFLDEPLVMKTLDEETNHTSITGSAGRMYTEFTQHINGTFFLINVENNSLHLHQKHIMQITMAKMIDISIHPFTYLVPYQSEGSYPIAHTNACIILPVVPEIDRSHYVFYAFGKRMWGVIMGLFVTFLAIELITNYTSENKFLFGKSIQAAVAGIINQPRDPSHPRMRTKIVSNSLLVFTGFFVANLYVAALTSLYSTTVYGKQPETVDEILSTGLEILLLNYEIDMYFETKLFPEKLKKRCRIIDPDTLANNLNSLNTSYIYIVKEERLKLISYQQSRLWKPIFKVAHNFCVPNMFLSFPLQLDSPFYEILKTFTMNVESSGLYLKWVDMSQDDTKAVGLVEILVETREHPVPLTLEYFKIIFAFFTICYASCGLCFLFENCNSFEWVIAKTRKFLLFDFLRVGCKKK